MKALREYQQTIYIQLRELLKQHRCICVQLATGGGKTPLASAIVESVFNKDKRAWFITPRRELVGQASKHFRKWNVPHGIIDAKNQESRAYSIFVVSKETLSRRWDKIKNWPDLIIIDECHLNLDFQIELKKQAPEKTVIIGITATPERGDGRGLSVQAEGIYEKLIEGPSIPELTSQGYLSPLRYFSPPLEGLSDLKITRGEYDEEELEELLQRRKVYGDMVSHYERHGKGKSALIFCSSIKSSEHAAERFRDKGYKFYSISSETPDTRRTDLIKWINDGTIDGLCGCDIFIYGLDVPRVEYGASIRPTLSRAVYMQSIGRIIRPWVDEVTGYKKVEALFFDHVNNILEHQDDNYPGIPLHYVPNIHWNFEGREKRGKYKCLKCNNFDRENFYCKHFKESLKVSELKTRCKFFVGINNIRLCPHLDFMYCDKPACSGCSHNPDKSVTDARKDMVIIPADLEELKKPIPLADMDIEDRRTVEDKIGNAILEYKTNPGPNPVKILLEIADSCGYSVYWVYWRLTPDNQHTVNVPVLAEICRQRGYKPGWIHIASQKVKARTA